MARIVHDDGGVCQAATEFAAEQDTPIAVDEFHTLNRCLGNAVGDVVTSFAGGSKCAVSDQAGERRRFVDIAIQACSPMSTGNNIPDNPPGRYSVLHRHNA